MNFHRSESSDGGALPFFCGVLVLFCITTNLVSEITMSVLTVRAHRLFYGAAPPPLKLRVIFYSGRVFNPSIAFPWTNFSSRLKFSRNEHKCGPGPKPDLGRNLRRILPCLFKLFHLLHKSCGYSHCQLPCMLDQFTWNKHKFSSQSF